ncbi:MAG TPA: hypothetical protein VGY66_29310, partial [Gemmataceae bacterium]|nr:hypothetical protein [Gemmataceae bacterium]
SPDRKREYSQDEAETRFLDLVLRQLRRGPVYVNAHRGTLQRALQVLSGHLDCPFVGSPRLCSEAAVYRDFGYAIAPIIQVKSPEGRAIIKEGKFIRLFGTGDQQPVEIGEATSIQLSAFMSRPDDPVMEGLVHVNRESWRAGGHN